MSDLSNEFLKIFLDRGIVASNRPLPPIMRPTASPMLNFSLRGGIPQGVITGIIGETQGGKTTIALIAAAQALYEGETVIWLDFENSFPSGTAMALGIYKHPNLIVVRDGNAFEPKDETTAKKKKADGLKTGTDVLNAVIETLRHNIAIRDKNPEVKGIGLIVIDSLAMTSFRAVSEGNMDNNTVGYAAREWKKFANIIGPMLSTLGTSLITINHINRAIVSPGQNPESESGGRFWQYAFYTKIRTIGRAESTISDDGGVYVKIRFRIVKHKSSSLENEQAIYIYYAPNPEDSYIDISPDLASVGKEFEIFKNKEGKKISGPAAWYLNDEFIAKGFDSAVEKIRSDQNIFDTVANLVNEKIFEMLYSGGYHVEGGNEELEGEENEKEQ